MTNSLFFKQLFFGQKLYDLSTVNSDTPWGSLNLEQQGEIVKNLYILQKGGTVAGGLSLQDYDNIFGSSDWHGDEPSHPIQTQPIQHCFVKGTPILLADGSQKVIEAIEVGDVVQAFDGLTALQPRRVVRLFRNTTTELLELTPTSNCRDAARASAFDSLTVTPGHAFLTEDGQFREIGETIRRSRETGSPAKIVLSTGEMIAVEAKHVAWAQEQYRYEQSDLIKYESSGAAALAARAEVGWKTYNFEVEDLNTYVAAGVRVHNQSAPTIALSEDEFEREFGHAFSGSLADQDRLVNGVADGSLSTQSEYVEVDGTTEYTAPYLTSNGDKIVITADANSWFASMVRNGEVEQIIQNNSDGTRHVAIFDPGDDHAYTKVDLTEDANGNITNVAATLDPNVIAAGGSIGQIFGSAIGRSIAGNNAFAQLAAGTVGGFIGQRLGAELAESLQTNIANFDFTDAFAHFGVGISGAAAGSVASFLTAELGTALGLNGFGAQLFNSVVGGYAGSMLNQVITHTFEGTIEAIQWSTAFSSATSAVSGSIGSLLANQIVHAENIGGMIGGQLAGAVGGIIGAATVVSDVVLNFILPGIGAFLGTVLGTLIGNLFGTSNWQPVALNVIKPGSYLYETNYYSSQDGGDPAVSDTMGKAAIGMINAYLTAVNGVALGQSTQKLIGFIAPSGTDYPPYVLGDYVPDVPRGPFIIRRHYAAAEAAASQAAIDLLQGTEAIGGNLLLKRAHHNGNAADMLTLAGDLQVAQDYERYLDNREVINALIAANPNTAFTEGWAATFARVQDLGLSHYGATDFLGGMVAGYLDSIRKAGLSFNVADLSVKHGSDGSVTIAIHVPANVDIPGALSVFASHTDVVNDATGKIVNLVFTDGLAAGNFHGPASSTVINGVNQVTASAGYNIWFGRDDMPNSFTDSQGSSQDILVGGVLNDVIRGGNGADFIDGGSGNDQLYGNAGSDVLRGGKGADAIYGAQGNDTYVFNRGDGIDTVLDDYRYTVWMGDRVGSQDFHGDGGYDALAFGAGIKPSDIALQLSGNDLIVGIKDPANPGLLITQMVDRITLRNWLDRLDRIEKFIFSDGTTLDFSYNTMSNLTAGFSIIDTAGSTSLLQTSNGYYFYSNGIGPSLKYQGAAISTLQFSPFVPIAAEQTATGYDVLWKIPGQDQYTVWSTDSSGNYIANIVGVVPGSSSALQALESVFHQDINGDGIAAIETRGSTSLFQSGGGYRLNDVGSGSGPQLKYQGSAVSVGQFSPFVAIAAEKTATGYDVAWKMPGQDQYTVWSTDSSGNYIANIVGVVTGASTALMAVEATFQQDLNGDGILGPVTTMLETAGSTSLALVGNTYSLVDGSNATGPQLLYHGSAVTAGQFTPFIPIAAEKTATGYDVAWKIPGQDQYTVWSTDDSGNYIANIIGVVSGSSQSLRELEPVFHQDLNGDGVIGVPTGSPVVLDLGGDGIQLAQLSSSSARFDMDGQNGRDHTAWTTGGDALLAIDLAVGGGNGADGVIDQTKEIVFTAWAPGTTSDMAALAQVFDTNHNGQLDAGDSRWSDFRVWRDANGDGISQGGEVKSLDAIGIVSVGLAPSGPSQAFADGSAISGLANFVWNDGSTGTAADVSFAYQPGAGEAAALPMQLAERATDAWHQAGAGTEPTFADAPSTSGPLEFNHWLVSAASHHWQIA